MKLCCWCPTYKRPLLLANAVACFEAQSYPDREMLIFDDAGQFHPQTGDRWKLVSFDDRFPNLPAKFAAMREMTDADVIVVWEDDDAYLPHHLEQIASVCDGSEQWFTSSTVYSNYNQKKGDVILEGSAGRFHSSWAYSTKLFDKVGGYDQTGDLNFDQRMYGKLSSVTSPTEYLGEKPSFVYRWGNGVYHASAAGDKKYQWHWDNIGRIPVSSGLKLIPRFDVETNKLYEKLSN